MSNITIASGRSTPGRKIKGNNSVLKIAFFLLVTMFFGFAALMGKVIGIVI